MAERHDGGGGGGSGKGGKILSMTVKRARRVQEKMMQKLGKSDQTRDEVFEEFVNNFNKQNASAFKLQKELMKYMNSIRVLYQNSKSMSETLKELYEEDWDGCEKQRDLMEQRILLWEDLLTSLTSRTVEPMTNYISRFSDIKIRIQKRERKMVDYDHRRRELEHTKSKAKVNDQKVQQAEETHTQAKQLYDEITDELYEELPTLYDSRIQFHAQIFQSIAAAETRFHAEISKVDEELARVMDGLAAEAATGIHSTKKQRNALSNTPKLLSRPEEESEEDSEGGTESQPTSRSPSLKQSHLSPTPSEPNQNSIDPDTSTSSEVAAEPTSGGQPKKPPPFRSPVDSETGAGESEGKGDTEDQPEQQENEDTAVESPPANEELLTDADREQNVASPLKTPPPKPAPLELPPPSDDDTTAVPTETAEESGTVVVEKEAEPPENLLFTALATHLYQGEDEDELTFEKGDVIYVVPYDDPEDEEEGWCMGVLKKNGDKGIFPENFTKRQD